MPLINLYFETKYIVIILNTFTSIGAELNDNIIIYFITTVFNSIICFILYYFLEKESKSEKEEEKMKSEYVGFTIEKKENIYNNESTVFTAIQGFILYFCYQMIIFYFVNVKGHLPYESFISVSFLFAVLSNHFFSNEKMYMHHFVSITGLIILMFFDREFLIRSTKDIRGSILYYGLKGFRITYVKYLMQNKFLSPYLAACASNVFLTFRHFCIMLTKDDKDGYFKYKINFDFFYFLISGPLNTIFEHLTIYYYSPFHHLLVENVKKVWDCDNFYDFIILLLNILFTLIYCEIITINIWGLGSFTKENIKKRGEEINKHLIENFELSQRMSSNRESSASSDIK